MTFNQGLTKEEQEKIDEAVRSIGEYGTIEIIKNGHTMDIVQSKRIRIRNGRKDYFKG